MMSRRFVVFAAYLFAALPLSAAVFRNEPFSRRLQIEPNGGLTIENPTGSIIITGISGNFINVNGVRTVHGDDTEAVREGQARTEVQHTGNARAHHIRTATPFPPPKGQRWGASVSYVVEVPYSTNLNIVSNRADRIRVSSVSGNVFIKSVTGLIELNAATGSLSVDTVAGDVKVTYPNPPRADSRISSINGQIEVVVPENASFEWLAQTLHGDIYSSLPVRGGFLPQAVRAYRGSVNGGRTPRLFTTAITGRAYLLGMGHALTAAKVYRTPQGPPPPPGPPAQQLVRVFERFLVQPPGARRFVLTLPRADGKFQFSTTLGNVMIGELTGDGRVATGAGEIVLARVHGSLTTESGGGPLNLGDISGPLTAHTTAGDVLVRAARKGGTISTDAGNIQVVYAGGKLSLYSGGGDINVRQAAAPVRAESRSGDISINMDSSAGSQAVTAKSVGGNIVLNVSPGYGADVEAIALTYLGQTDPIQSDFAGLEISTERIGNRIRTRAVGKINGGGEKVVLNVEDGTIYLRSRVLPPVDIPPAP